ncbi:hypothetical protein BGZ50_002731 [Haplosporangium sp. Z 11]|nr:hypothetical protein BGZ50_002731 [Haplosporangium sp. Z 11]
MEWVSGSEPRSSLASSFSPQARPSSAPSASSPTSTPSPSSSSPPAPEGVLEPAVFLLDPNTKYLSYLPFAGLTNQFIALEVALFAATRLNRTLIIPPIISNTHDNENTHQRWSQFLDLPRFTNLTGIPILEWDTVRPLNHLQRQVGKDQALLGLARGEGVETDQWRGIAENVICQIIHGYGAPDLDTNISARNFAWHFLFRVTFVRPPPRKTETPVYGRTKIALDKAHEADLVDMDDQVARYQDYDDEAAGHGQGPDGKLKILFLSHTFKIKDPEHVGRYWREIGRNLHFVPQLMEYATMLVNAAVLGDKDIEVVTNDDPEEAETNENYKKTISAGSEEQKQEEEEIIDTIDTKVLLTRIPHIAVHLRRGDIGMKCSETDMATCIVPFERYAEAVDRARIMAATANVTSHLPVVVTTDSDFEDDFRQIREFGWHQLDHEKYKTEETWGPFGPAMVDAGILAQADVFIGSEKSTMTRIAAARQKAWYQRKPLYPVETTIATSKVALPS